MHTIPQITPQQLQQMLADTPAVLLLDVREDYERTICSLPGATHIPMHLLTLHHNQLPDDCPIVVYCHHGIRSLHSAAYLADIGFTALYNLKGGIDAWAREIDPDMPRY